MPWLIHLYTASGVLLNLAAALELTHGQPDPRHVFLYLTLAVLIDATDGPLARRADVKHRLPHIHGRTIDDLVDFLTFTFIPMLLIARLGWVPRPALLFVAPPLLTSLLGFANAGAKDESGGFFLGFPSYWNIVAFYNGILAAHGLQSVNAAILIALSVLTLMPVGFIYPNLAPRRWKLPILGGAFVWTAMLLAMLPRYPSPPLWLVALSLAYPLFYTAVSVMEYGRHRRANLAQ
ncbi:MAG: phosphatidylcholine synthase [Acidobacteriota bacterium]|nr:phosphatidylcholine synthase [Acidobacteriota bacterium]